MKWTFVPCQNHWKGVYVPLSHYSDSKFSRNDLKKEKKRNCQRQIQQYPTNTTAHLCKIPNNTVAISPFYIEASQDLSILFSKLFSKSLSDDAFSSPFSRGHGESEGGMGAFAVECNAEEVTLLSSSFCSSSMMLRRFFIWRVKGGMQFLGSRKVLRLNRSMNTL